MNDTNCSLISTQTLSSDSFVKAQARSSSGLFAKALLKDALYLLPNLPDTNSLDEIKAFVRSNIHYNSAQTRDRFSAYILRHVFISGKPDRALRLFARAFPNSVPLQDVCLYRFIRSQPLIGQFILEGLLPAIGQGVVPKTNLQHFLAHNYPTTNEKSLKSTASAILEVLSSSGIARVDKTTIRFQLREINTASFAFILHSHLSEPGIYSFETLLNEPIFKMMLWKHQAIIPALYELRDRELISKISEVDNLRQFNTQFTLEQAVERLI